MTSSEANRPKRMFRQDRPVDSEFSPTEDLYHRCLARHVVDKRLLPEAIRFPNFSVNRSKYSEPEDVLIPQYSQWGVATFQVKDLPPQRSTDTNTTYTWQVVHDPLEENYAHSEVRTYKNGHYSETLDVPKTIKKEFRQVLSDKARIIKLPNVKN